MPERTLAEINAELQAKQAEIDELTGDDSFRETVDATAEDLGEVTEFLDDTATGIEEAGEDLAENYEELSDAIDGLQELTETDAFTESLEAGGEFVEGVTGGLESVTNVVGEVQGGLESLGEALEAIQQIDDLATADGSEALDAFADAFEAVVDRLGPLVDKVPVLGPFFRLYGAGIRNIAISAGKIEAIVDRNQALYAEISPGHSLYLTPEYLASEQLRRLNAEYEALLDEAMDAAAAERDARDAPSMGSGFDPVKHVVHMALDRCSGLLPDYGSGAFRRWLRTKTALDSARLNHGSAQGGVTMAEMYGEDTSRPQELLDSATARLEAAQEAFDTEGAEHQAARDAYDDCVKSRIREFSAYERLDDWEIRRIGVDYPQWDIRGWEPPEEAAVVVPAASTVGVRRDGAMAVVGGAFVLGGLLLLSNAVTSPIAAVSGAFVGGAAGSVVSSPFPAQVFVDSPAPAGSVDTGSGSTGTGVVVTPAVNSVCNETDHFPDEPATDGDGNQTPSPSKQVIGVYFVGLPPDTRVMMEVARIGPRVGVVNSDGYAEFQIPLRSYGTYEITSVSADVDGSSVLFDPVDFGSPFRVGDPEAFCGQSSLSPPTTSTTTTSTTTTTTAAPTTRSVEAGGGAVATPPEATETATPATVAPGSPASDGADLGAGTLFAGLGAVVCGSALLGGSAAPGMRTRAGEGQQSGPRTFTAQDRALIQEIYQGADEAGLKIAGISSIGAIEDAFAGSKDDPVYIGRKLSVTLRVGEDGSLIPRRGDTDQAATSIVQMDVMPSVEFDGDGDPHVVWNAYVRQIDVASSRIIETSRSGPTAEEWRARVGGRSDVEVGNDPEFEDWVVGSMPDSPAEAARQALGGWAPTSR